MVMMAETWCALRASESATATRSSRANVRRWTEARWVRDDIAAAIEKVGDNCETVRKKLGA